MSGETKKTVICLVGLASLCAMFRAPFFGSLTMGITSNFSGLRVVYDAVLILIGCILALVSLQRTKALREGERLEDRLVTYAVGGILAVVGVVANSAGRSLGITADAFYVVSIVVLCIGFAALVVGWFRVLVGLSKDKITTMITGAFVVSHVFGLFDVFPRGWASMLSLSYPLLALICLYLLRNVPACQPERGSEPLLRSDYLRIVQICTMILIFAELLCGAFLRSRWAHGGVNYAPNPRTIYSYLVSLGVGLAFLCIAWRSKTTSGCTLVIGSIGLVGFIVFVVLFSLVPPQSFSMFVTALYSALLVYSMALISLWGIDGKHSFISCAAVFLVMFGGTAGITSSIIPAILAYLQLTPADFLAPVGAAAGLVISLGMCVVLFVMIVVNRRLFMDKLDQNESALDDDVTAQPKYELSSDERHEYAMDMIAARYDLTERERETASLMARGYTAKHVAEELTVAVSTVKGYSKSIYRKMGIHRKDELIEIVKETKNQV